MQDYALKIENLGKTYRAGFLCRKIKSLKNLNLEVLSGEIMGILGPNGAGKTTTFKIILQLISPTKGKVSFNLKNRGNDFRYGIGYLPENPYFYPYLTGEETLRSYGKMFGLKGEILDSEITKLFEQVDLKHAKDKQLKNYSRGMLQRIGIAQALINDPQFLILDEPMSGLDPFGRKQMREIILRCKENGKTVMFSSHILSDVEVICDRAALLVKGDLQQVFDVKKEKDKNIVFWEVRSELVSAQLRLKYRTFAKEDEGKTCIHNFPDDMVANKFIEEILAEGGKLISFAPFSEGLEEKLIKLLEQ